MWQGARRWLSALEADPLVAGRVLVWAWVLTRSLLLLALLAPVLWVASGALLQKFDLVRGTLCLLAVLGLWERRVRLAGAAVALAVLTKGFPLLVVPALLVAQLAGAPARSLAQAVSARWARLRDGVLAGGAGVSGAGPREGVFTGRGPLHAHPTNLIRRRHVTRYSIV